VTDDTTVAIPRWLAEARAGSREALGRAFDACRNYLLLIAEKNLDPDLRAKCGASDLVQETFLEAQRDFADFAGRTEAEWLAWLRRILDHNAADFVRRYRGTGKRQVGREVPLAGPGDSSAPFGAAEPAADGESPSGAAVRHEDELMLAEALTRLSPDHREVIVLRNLQRLSFDEVARRMNRSRPAAQMLWMRALAKLQEQLGVSASGRLTS
jgi:RNA polymerase sigma-70 factor, ECF subfamily